MTTTANIHAALAKALPLVGAAIKGKANPAFKSTYADLASVIEAIRPVADHGVWFRQVPVPCEGNRAAIETFYIHTSGEELSAGVTDVPVTKSDAQGYGSAQTYCRRYGLMAAFGIAPEDDDGNAAAAAKPRAQNTPPTAPAQKINAQQLAALQAAINELPEGTTKRICDAYKIEALPDLPVNAYDAAIKRLLELVAAEQAKQKAAA